MAERRYSKEEVDAILGRAIERERNGDGLSHEELLAIASEIAVSPDSLEKAAAEVMREHHEEVELASMRAEARRGLVGHVVPYVAVSALLTVINFFTSDFPWAIFPICGWGIGVFFHALDALFPTRKRLERLLERDRRRRRRREMKREINSSARTFEAAVGEGVASLLKVAAEKIQESADQANGRPAWRCRVDGEPAAPTTEQRASFRWERDAEDSTEAAERRRRR